MINPADVNKVKEETWTEVRSYYGLRFQFNGLDNYRVLLGMRLIYLGCSMHEALGVFNTEAAKKEKS